MPNIKSAKKSMRTSEARRLSHHAVKSQLSTTRRKLYASISSGDKTASETEFRVYCAQLDKAVKKGSVKANNASRRKSRAAASLAAI